MPKTYETTQMNPEERTSQVVTTELAPHEAFSLSLLASPMYDPADVEDYLGFRAHVSAEVSAGDKTLLLVDLRDREPDELGKRDVAGHSVFADLILIGKEDWKGGFEHSRGFVGIRRGEVVDFGRANNRIAKRFDFTKGNVSRSHFTVTLLEDGSEIVVTDNGSLNKTTVTHSTEAVYAGRTVSAAERIKRQHGDQFQEADLLAPYGYFGEAPILGRKSSHIAGGVYVGGGSREAIHVDDTDPRIQAVYDTLNRKRTIGNLLHKAGVRRNSKVYNKKTLEDVLATVTAVMPYDTEDEVVGQLSRRYRDQFVSLGEYIEKGKGVCRHQGLLAAYLVERLIADGKLTGSVKVERNTVPDKGGTHAWATYVDDRGYETVIDPAQGFLGSKKEASKQNFRWNYYLPVN
jgi:hypothetical protein